MSFSLVTPAAAATDRAAVPAAALQPASPPTRIAAAGRAVRRRRKLRDARRRRRAGQAGDRPRPARQDQRGHRGPEDDRRPARAQAGRMERSCAATRTTPASTASRAFSADEPELAERHRCCAGAPKARCGTSGATAATVRAFFRTAEADHRQGQVRARPRPARAGRPAPAPRSSRAQAWREDTCSRAGRAHRDGRRSATC